MTKATASKSASSKTASKVAPAKPASKATPVKAGSAAARKAPAAKTAAAAPKAKTVVAPAVKPMSQPVKAKAKPDADAKEKSKKAKLVRDSFTMPEAEYAALGEVKKACLKAGIEVRKSELLRVGVALVRQLDVLRLKEVLGSLPTLKAGRPKKGK